MSRLKRLSTLWPTLGALGEEAHELVYARNCEKTVMNAEHLYPRYQQLFRHQSSSLPCIISLLPHLANIESYYEGLITRILYMPICNIHTLQILFFALFPHNEGPRDSVGLIKHVSKVFHLMPFTGISQHFDFSCLGFAAKTRFIMSQAHDRSRRSEHNVLPTTATHHARRDRSSRGVAATSLLMLLHCLMDTTPTEQQHRGWPSTRTDYSSL